MPRGELKMAAYNLIVSYDLNRPGQDYQTLFSAIRSLGGAIKVQKSVWYVDTNYDEKQARDQMRSRERSIWKVPAICLPLR